MSLEEKIDNVEDGPSCGNIGELNNLRIAIVTISTTRSENTDKSGQVMAEIFENAGHTNIARDLIKDNINEIEKKIIELVNREDIDMIVTTGGTGVTPDDVTVEAISPILDKELPGFGELFRYLSYEEIGALSMASRSMAGISKQTPIFCLPGSSNAVRLGVEKIILLICNHTVEQARRGKLVNELAKKM
jgi:molybdenum cofactor biosynthesis protein B